MFYPKKKIKEIKVIQGFIKFEISVNRILTNVVLVFNGRRGKRRGSVYCERQFPTMDT